MFWLKAATGTHSTLTFTLEKTQFASGVGLAYNSVMSLITKAHLGSSYNLYVDNFYTIPKDLQGSLQPKHWSMWHIQRQQMMMPPYNHECP